MAYRNNLDLIDDALFVFLRRSIQLIIKTIFPAVIATLNCLMWKSHYGKLRLYRRIAASTCG